MFKRKLWKRVLPIILSVAMVLETAPVTVLATEIVEETALGETKTGDGNEDAQNEAGNVSEDGNTTAASKDDSVENTAENEENTAAALDTKIVVNESALRNYCNNNSSYQYDIDKKLVLVKYDESNANPFGNVLTLVKSSYIKVEVDGSTNTSLEKSLKYQWQKADGTDLAANAVPTEAGGYMLVVTLDAVDGVCSKAELKLSFTIAKRQLSVAFPDAYEVVPGTTVGAFKKDFRYSLHRERTSWKTEATEAVTDAKTTYIDTASVTVYDAYRMETPLADDAKFLEGTDYVVSVKPVLKQTVSSNYAIPEETVLKIKSYGRIDTWIEAAQKNPKELIAKVYDETSEKQIGYETDIKDKLTVTVKAYEENTVEGVTLDNAAVTEVWFNGAKEELGEGAEFEPKTAGTYYLGFRYYPTEDDVKIYKACKDSDFIKVILEKAPLTLVPALKDGAEVFYTGMTEADVLKYADYTLLNAKNEEVTIDRDTFWGVSYDDIEEVYGYSQTKTKQSYEPVFRLLRAKKDAGGNLLKDENGKEIWTENGGTEKLDASKYCYRLVFTGKKTVYTKAGVEVSGKRVGVNGSDVEAEDKNHAIVTTADVLLANYVDVPVAEAKKTTMDVSGIVQQNFNATNLNALYQPAKLVSKVYDGKALYEPSRAEYKKAVVTSTEDNQEIAKDYDSAIKYTWYKINRVKAVYDETDPENPVQTGWEVDRKTQVGATNNNIPTDAGEYMLEIRFAKTGYVSCTETIYYRIAKQLFVVDFEEMPKAYKNESVDSYTYTVHYKGAYNVYAVPENQYSEAIKTEDNLLKDWYQLPFYDDLSDYPYGGYYKLNWYVEQIRLDENNAPVKDDDGNVIYDRLGASDRLSIPGEATYRLGVELTAKDSNYTNYEIVYDAELRPTPKYTNVYHNDFENVMVYEAEAGTVEITLELDAQRLVTEKDYDGKPFYASADDGWKAVQSALTVKYTESGDVVAQKDLPEFEYDIFDRETNEWIDFDEMVYGGSYTLSLYALSDATYQFAYLEDAAEYTIHKIPLTVTPVLTEDILAGAYAGSNNDGVIYNLSKTEFAGYAEADADAFAYGTPVYTGSDGTKTLGFGAYDYNALSAFVSKAGSADRYYGYIKYGKEYAVKFTGALAYPHSRNYDVTYARTLFGATRRGNSTTAPEGFANTAATAFARRVDNAAVIITPTGAIPYIKDVHTTDRYENPISGEGNYFAFRINAPYEFYENNGSCLEKYYKNFIYRSSIEAAGGFILRTTDNDIKVVFPVKEKAAKSFDIIWENGYTEKYTLDFTNAVLADDLTRAVAPKSLSFNGVNTKMTVGEEQQLDVKIKKAQINDIIYIDYRVTQGEDVISVITDDREGIAGYATALKPGKATVTAVPVKLVNGVKTKIDGAKAATVAITVSDVTAPAIKKVAASDKKVTFTYTKPANGYRREVYILAGKKKAEDFEALIRSTNNGQWRGVFAVEPRYYVNESTDAKTKVTQEKEISGLSKNGAYTLYVRNVSAIRTLGDGSCVQLSAKGTVKSFKTTKPQVEALALYAKNDAGNFTDTKNVKLTDKTEQLYTMGQFSTIDIDAAADTTDKSWLTLPLDKAYSKTFAVPKLVYAVSSEPDGLDKVDVSKIRDFRNYTYIGGRYYKKTDIATVDKTGKVTFKGVGKIYVIVYDQDAGEKKALVTLTICAVADSVKAKDTKLAVGKGLYLSSLLTYFEGKTALTGMDYQNTGVIGTTYKPNLTISAEEVTKINNEGNFYLRYTGDGDYYIYAKKPNATCSIALKDGTLSASLKIQSTPIEPVKDLKITNAADDRFTISFSYPVETYLDGVTYRIDITDARGSLVDSRRCGASDDTGYDGKKKTFIKVVNYENDKIARLSKYSVSVTTLCADEASAKPVTKTVKTTDFPASYGSVSSYGGMAVYAHSTAGIDGFPRITLQERRYLTSGNTYTLEAVVSPLAMYRMTDTLTWKSSDTKVATVKAKAGTYTAQMNALKPGITEIEVTSKITKKVIARYPVFVKAVGNAATYYGDYEYTGEYTYTYDPYYTSGMEVLTLQNPVHVTSSEVNGNANYHYKWVKFTAPAYGRYQFHCDCTGNGELEQVLSSLKDRTIHTSDITHNYRIAMLEGETFYFKVSGTFTMKISDYTKQGTSFTADDGSVLIDSDSKQLIEFRATEDNIYTFYSKELPNLSASLSAYDENNNVYLKKYNTWTDTDGIRKRDFSLSTGEIIYLEVPAGQYTLYVEKRNVTILSDGMQIVLTDEVKEKWYTYTAAEEGLYTFKSKAATSALTASRYESLKDWAPASWNVTKDGNDFTGRMTLKAGDKVLFCISAEEAATATMDVTPEIPVKISVGDETALPVKTENRRWVAFTLPEAGRYRFRAVSTEADASYDVNLRYYQNAIEENEMPSIANGEIVVSDNISNQPDAKAGDTVYVEVTTTKEGIDAANVKVSLTQVTATELAVGEITITMKDGDEYWYTFAQPKEGNYIIQSQVTPNAGADGVQTDTHTLSAAWYTRGLEQKYPGSNSSFDAIGDYDFYDESSYSTSTIRTFRVSADAFGFDADGTGITTTAKIIVKELTATPLELGTPVDVSLLRNEKRWYSFTAPETETYIFKRSMKEGRVETVHPKSNKLGDGTSVEGIDDYYLKDLEAGETFYIREWARYGDAAEFTRLAEGPVKLPVGVPQSVTVTKDAPVWCRYTAEEDNQHALRYDTENITDVAVSYADSLGGYEYTISNGYRDLILSKNDKRYIKLTTTSETPIEVTIQMGPIEPIAVSAGETKEITLEPDQRSTWYSFTAEEAGRYVICKTYESGDGTCMNCYNNLTHPKPAGTLHWFDVTFEQYYEVGETVYIQAYTTASTQQTTSLIIEKVEDAVPMSGMSVDDEPIEKDKKKGYLYTAEKTGLYHFANKGTGYNFCVYMDITDKRFSESQNAGCSGDIFLKENDTVYFGVSASKDTTVKITMEFVSEVQTLSVGEENTVNLSSVEKGTLAAVPIAESGFYDFEIAYSAEGDDIDFADENGKVYYMLGGQIIGGQELEKLQDSAFVESSGTVAFFEKLAMQGDTVYLYLPKLASATGATVTVTKSDTAEVIEVTMKKSGEHTFDISDEAWYVFDVPKDGGYKLTFDLSDSEDTSYFVRRYLNGLDLKTVAYSQTINKDCTVEIQPVKRNQRICFYIEKKTGASNVPLTVWASGV